MKEVSSFERNYYQPVRQCLKRGTLDNFKRDDLEYIDDWVTKHLGGAGVMRSKFQDHSLQAKFLKLQFYLLKEARSLRVRKDPVFHKAWSILFDLREYLGGLGKHKDRLEEMAEGLQGDIRKCPIPRTDGERELLKEQIRLVSVHANQLYRNNRSEDASRIIKTLKGTITEKLAATNKCRTVLAGIHYLEARILRNEGKFPDCERSLSESIELYTDWTRDNREPDDLTLASYKNAMSLGAIAWCKNMRGFNRDALNLINSARLLISGTGWKLDKAHLDLVYADISRTFLGEDSETLADAIAIARKSYETFRDHPHPRLKSRAAFTLALLNYYAGDPAASESYLDEVEAYSAQKHEARWSANALILRARNRNKRDKFKISLEELLPQVFRLAKDKPMDDRLVVAYIVKAESHLGLGEYAESVDALQTAQKVNDRSSRQDGAVNSERNKGWIFLDLADTYLRSGDLLTSKSYLERWRGLRGIRYKGLLDFAATIQKKHEAALPDFVITDGDDLSWKALKSELLHWLIENAKLRAKSDAWQDIAKVLGITTPTLLKLRKEAKVPIKKKAS